MTLFWPKRGQNRGFWTPFWTPFLGVLGPLGPKPLISSINIWGSGQDPQKRGSKMDPFLDPFWPKMTLFWPISDAILSWEGSQNGSSGPGPRTPGPTKSLYRALAQDPWPDQILIQSPGPGPLARPNPYTEPWPPRPIASAQPTSPRWLQAI